MQGLNLEICYYVPGRYVSDTTENCLCYKTRKWVEVDELVTICDGDGDKYRFGYSKHEKLNEVSGIGNTIDMGDRWLDTRTGRAPRTDQHENKYPSLSPYW